MRLAKLTLAGFKSFADRTEFTFDAPITGIVGPNGCGKSNVVDAVKWVLGERSAKSLRGKEMIDVIFSGSAGRQPMGLASVVLTFDNPELTIEELGALQQREHTLALGQSAEASAAEEALNELDGPAEAASLIDRSMSRRRALPIDAERVDVERRLYRDGTSQYLINSRRARLKDIRDLFLDTGVGADAYSIIEQGKVDALLLANPVERRTFFEEAAGVARFKVRRVESQRKLERAETNLVRVREQLDSTERRLRLVKGQAAKARRFQQLDAELKAVRMAVAFDQYYDLRQRLDGLTSRLQEMESQRLAATTELARFEEAKQEAELRRHDVLEQQRGAEREKAAAEHRFHSAEQRRAMSERAGAEARAQLEEETRHLESIGAELAKLSAGIDHQAALVEEVSEMLTASERKLAEHAAARETAQTDVAEKRLALAEARAVAQNIDRELTSLTARLDADQRRLHGAIEQCQNIESRIGTLDREQRDAGANLGAAERDAGERRGRIGAVESRIAGLVDSAESLSGDQRMRASRLSELEQQHARLDSRRATLHEMVEARTGLGDAVKALLDRAAAAKLAPAQDGGLLAGVRAPLADLIEVESEDALPVEAALGATLQAIVVPGIGPLLSSSELESLVGRVTFLPLDASPREEAADPLAFLMPGHVTSLATLVNSPDDLKPLVTRLLARTYLVRDLDAAVMLAGGPASGLNARFVTRIGAVLEPDGRITAGPFRAGGTDSGEGLLQRKSELADLRSRLAELSGELTREREALASIDAEAAGLNRELSTLRHLLATEQRQLVSDETRRQRHQSEIDRIGRERPMLEGELQQLTGRSEAIRAEHRALEDRAQSLRRLLDERSAVTRQMEQEIETAQAGAEASAEKLTGAKVEAGQFSEKLGNVRRELRRMELALEDMQGQKLRLSQSVERREASLDAYTQAVAECSRDIEAAQQESATLAASLESLADLSHEAAASATSLGEQVLAARQRAGLIERDWNSLEITKRELEVRRENIEQRASEDLRLELAWEYKEYTELMAAGDVSRLDPEKSAAETEELRDGIRKLGNVNIDSIEEERTLEGRNEELIRQVADIDRACIQLRELIEKLNTVSEGRFKESFTAIQEFFSGQTGMFRRLFGGGKAELRLIPDENGEINWLESGIEVIAKPPGKEPRTINQLSGGEKTMTAVALLLSIFQSKPSPFCVLDEVDAALDDANVDRFASIIRQFLDRCHFIVITHNKKTMQAADQLYGVTMQERGVSRRVQVKFEHLGEGGAIKLDATTGEADVAPATTMEVEKKGPSLREKLAGMRRGKRAVDASPEPAPEVAAAP